MKQTLCLLAIITSTAVAHANEGRHVHAIDLAIGRMEKGLVDQDASTWTLGFKDAHAELFDEGFAKSPKRAALLDRYRAAIKAAGVVMGPRAAKIVAREEREEEVKEDAVEILKDGISICSGALSPNGGAGNVAELDQRAGEYAKKLERAMRVDPRVVLSTKAYVGSGWGGAIGNIAACELGLAFRRSTFEDSPPVPVTPLDGQRKTVKGCGFVEYTVRAEKLRGGKLGAWEADGNES